MRRVVVFISIFMLAGYVQAASDFWLIKQNKGASVHYEGKAAVVQTALSMLLEDSRLVAAQGFEKVSVPQHGAIIVGIAGEDAVLDQFISRYDVDVSDIKGQWEAFGLHVVGNKKENYLLVIGSDARGAAYGVLELSRVIGVSPWVWWADVVPEKSKSIMFPRGYKSVQKPSVQYRGIFLNDEDWGLMPWSSMTYEPSERKGQIGPKTYSRIFELLLRLRANTLWPAMHEVTIPFYFTPGNREAAAKYGIILGTSHCEPLMRNSAREWDVSGKGDYNYVTNKAEMLKYWTERLQELQGAENIFTIGLRGKHDGMMQGVRTQEQHKAVLSQVIPDQRELLRKYINPDPSQVPQVFIPYKEVLDVYNDGLDVPEDITMVWCDDNYGYLKHFPDAKERARKGGNGVYYHVSYWGRPHDYLWLSTISPALLHQQMSLAYEKGVNKLWILNVGDIKPAEYQTELFLDMAWDIDQVNKAGIKTHLTTWLGEKFGPKLSSELAALQQEYYRLGYIRKPEHMGNTRVEESDPSYKLVKDLDWSEPEIRQRLKDYAAISTRTEKITEKIPARLQSSFFQLVQYPIQASAEMNKKLLLAQLARHGKADWSESHAAFARIVSLTATYNQLEDGKWNRMMDYKPRNLAVYQQVPEEQEADPLPEHHEPRYRFGAGDARQVSAGLQIIEGMGYTNSLLSISKGAIARFTFEHEAKDSVTLEIRLLPNHAVDGKNLRFAVAVDGNDTVEISYKTIGRSEEWKQNVLRNQAVRRLTIPVMESKRHQLEIKALDEGVLLDQVLIF